MRNRSGRRAFAVPALALPALVAALALAACSGTGTSPAPSGSAGDGASPEGTVTVYSGRSEELVDPILQQFEDATGIDVEVRYAGTTELATTILEEGDASPADVFLSQDGGALGALADADRLVALPADVLERVDSRFRSADGAWIGVSGRARVLAYGTRKLAEAALPDSVEGLTDPAWKGRIGWVPTNASFQTFVTALRVQLGEEGAREWLTAMQANQPKVYEGNAAALEAVKAGEIDAALINHYYLFQAQAESGETYPVANHFFTGGDPGALVNVAGIGILDTADHPVAAEQLVRFLLSEEAQRYFSEKTFEYPLATGAAADPRLPALAEIESPDLDLSDLADLDGTLTMLTEVGIL